MPYTILDTTSAWWKGRKAHWLGLGIRPEVQGRAENLLMGNQKQLLSYDVVCGTCGHKPPKVASIERGKDAELASLFDMEPAAELVQYPKAGEPCRAGVKFTDGCTGTYEVLQRASQKSGALASGTSIFDPVLCEALYRWYAPANGLVLDPFAGGAVRGVVAAKLGRRYVGVELRPEQVEDNRAQATAMGWPEGTVCRPTWVEGDSVRVLAPPPTGDPQVREHGPYDFVMSCPPYYDAEVYSDDPRDLSAQANYDDFTALHEDAIAHATRQLHTDRFAAWVIGEARGKDGNEYGLVPDTIVAFRKAGLQLHGTFVLANAIGSLPLRIAGQWAAARRPGRHHQQVLVFVKGDPRKACAHMEPLTLDTPTTE
jgi:hypothetical protein